MSLASLALEEEVKLSMAAARYWTIFPRGVRFSKIRDEAAADIGRSVMWI